MRIHYLSAMILGMLFTPMIGFSQTITIGEEYKGEITKALPKKSRDIPGVPSGPIGQQIFVRSLQVELKSGQSIAISLILTGDSRLAGLSLVDSSNSLIKSSTHVGGKKGLRPGLNGGDELEEKTSKIEVKEVPATGTYTIHVISNQAGAFTLFVKDLNKKRDAKTITAELEEARNRVAELEKELKEYDKK